MKEDDIWAFWQLKACLTKMTIFDIIKRLDSPYNIFANISNLRTKNFEDFNFLRSVLHFSPNTIAPVIYQNILNIASLLLVIFTPNQLQTKSRLKILHASLFKHSKLSQKSRKLSHNFQIEIPRSRGHPIFI